MDCEGDLLAEDLLDLSDFFLDVSLILFGDPLCLEARAAENLAGLLLNLPGGDLSVPLNLIGGA